MKYFIEKNSTEVCVLLNIIAVLALAIAVWIISMFPGRGAYETNIFSAYPPTVWLLLGVTIVGGFSSAFLAIRYKRQAFGWVAGLLLVVSTNAFVIALPYLRDYAFISNGDPVVHFNRTLYIIENGGLSVFDFYPSTHLLAAGFSLFSGLNPEVVVLSIPVVFYLVYITNTLFLGVSLGGGSAALGIMALMAAPLVFGTFTPEMKPTTLAVFMLPLFFAWLYRAYFGNPHWTDKLVFIIILLGLPFIHPWAVISAIIIFLLTIIASLYSIDETNRPGRLTLYPVILLGVLWLVWFSQFPAFYTVIDVIFSPQKMADSQIEVLTNPQISEDPQIIERADPEDPAEGTSSTILTVYRGAKKTYRTFNQFVRHINIATIYYIPAVFVILWVLAKIVKHSRQIPVIQLTLTLFVLFFILLAFVSKFADLFTSQPVRILNFATALVPALVTVWLFDPKHKDISTATWVRRILPAILIVSALVGAGVTYRTPLIRNINPGVSYAYQAGVRHLVDYMKRDGKTVYIVSSGKRNLNTVSSSVPDTVVQLNLQDFKHTRMPPHLGFDGQGGITGFIDPGYLMVSAYDRAYSNASWSAGNYLPKDFVRLHGHPAWNNIYSSGDLTLWRWSGLVPITPNVHSGSENE